MKILDIKEASIVIPDETDGAQCECLCGIQEGGGKGGYE